MNPPETQKLFLKTLINDKSKNKRQKSFIHHQMKYLATGTCFQQQKSQQY